MTGLKLFKRQQFTNFIRELQIDRREPCFFEGKVGVSVRYG